MGMHQRKRTRRRWRLGRGRVRHGHMPEFNGSGKQSEVNSCLTLRRAPVGQELCVTNLGGEVGQAQRLRELGVFEGQHVRVLSAGNPLICQVGDCRFGMCRRLADCILVEPVLQRAARPA